MKGSLSESRRPGTLRAFAAAGLVAAGVAATAPIGFAAERPDGGGEVRMAEHVTLRNGFDLICDHREESGGRVRLFTEADSTNFVEVAAAEIAAVELVKVAASLPPASTLPAPRGVHADLTPGELHELLSSAGATHNLDVHLLASLVRAESGGHTAAVSKKGAQGLMQLMPRTAAQLGVDDSLRADQNVAGGAAYLDSLLTRYHENLALALAAYNAGPAAVDRWQGVPPYRETRRYVARIIRDFNAAVKQAKDSGPHLLAANRMAPADAAVMGATARQVTDR